MFQRFQLGFQSKVNLAGATNNSHQQCFLAFCYFISTWLGVVSGCFSVTFGRGRVVFLSWSGVVQCSVMQCISGHCIYVLKLVVIIIIQSVVFVQWVLCRGLQCVKYFFVKQYKVVLNQPRPHSFYLSLRIAASPPPSPLTKEKQRGGGCGYTQASFSCLFLSS